jgi:hypothetical protein
MSKAVYNSAIHDVDSNSPHRAFASFACLRNAGWLLSLLLVGFATVSAAADWNKPEQDLARKIVAVTGPTRIAVAFENRSSLGKRDVDIVENGLRSTMQAAGLHLVTADQSPTLLTISLSENPTFYVWVAQIRLTSGGQSVAMVSIPRAKGSDLRDSFPMSLRKIPFFSQNLPILDVAVLEEAATPTRIAVLDPERLSWYRRQNASWQLEQAQMITHIQPWPRDVRGRLIPGRDHSLEIYLPGVICSAGTARLECRQSDDPWPLLSGASNGPMVVFPSAGIGNGASTVVPQRSAFFASTRNFFTGVITPPIENVATLPRFFSAAFLPQENNMLWLVAATDGRVHMIDGVSDQVANVSWGSDLAGMKTVCGAGWQVLASSTGGRGGDSIRAYEFPDRGAVAVTPEVEFYGAVTALWTESRGDTAVAVIRNRDIGTYEAFRLAMACGQ